VALALAWAPLLWQPAAAGESTRARVAAWGTGLGWVLGLTLAAWIGHQVPLGVTDQAHPWLGLWAVLGLAGLYLGLAALQWQRGCGRPRGAGPTPATTWTTWSPAWPAGSGPAAGRRGLARPGAGGGGVGPAARTAEVNEGEWDHA
jgi:hypothetical protein